MERHLIIVRSTVELDIAGMPATAATTADRTTSKEVSEDSHIAASFINPGRHLGIECLHGFPRFSPGRIRWDVPCEMPMQPASYHCKLISANA